MMALLYLSEGVYDGYVGHALNAVVLSHLRNLMPKTELLSWLCLKIIPFAPLAG
jgi:hypothetical protein